MSCACATLPDFAYYKPGRSLSRRLRPSIEKIADNGFRELYRCVQCGTHWRIDAHDKYQVRFIWKVGASRDDWAQVEHEAETKALMLETRGGTQNETCIWQGCTKPRIKGKVGSVYCVDHLYSIGARD